MRRVPLILLFLAAAAAAGVLSGCNDRLDDPTTSEGILTIEKVEPVVVEADVTATDPNGNPTPLVDDETVVTLKNRVRTGDPGQFSDVFIKKSEQFCTSADPNSTGNITSGQGVASFTIPAGGTADVTIVAVTVTEKTMLAAPGDSWKCFVRFEGEDLSGNPAQSEFAGYVISFVDK